MLQPVRNGLKPDSCASPIFGILYMPLFYLGCTIFQIGQDLAVRTRHGVRKAQLAVAPRPTLERMARYT